MLVSLLTAGRDKPYVLGLATSLWSHGAIIDLVGSNELDCNELHNKTGLTFFNLRGDVRPDASFGEKAVRVLKYYAKLLQYGARSRPEVFHILWNNKFEWFDRTALMLYYRLLGKRIVFTAHNVNAGKRDCRDTLLNRLTLRSQYRLADHIFVHTEKMKHEMQEQFGVNTTRITVVPFGINNTAPNTHLTSADAKRRLGMSENEKTLLFFGRITPYKGLEYLVAASRQILAEHKDYRVIIAGKPEACEEYWNTLQDELRQLVKQGRVLLHPDFIPDDEIEIYFKAADALVLPYREIYQSGVLFLAYSFGLPVLAADVGSLKDDIVEGETGFVFRAQDETDLARTIKQYFASDLYANLNDRRAGIRKYASEHHSWDVVAEATMRVYAQLLQVPSADKARDDDARSASIDIKAPS
jgi:glycosyltransferase involved in cell wall biosynthesis